MESRGTVLVADDHDDLRISLTELFDDARYETRAAANGQEALALARGLSEPAVMIVDLKMPELSGWELIEQVRQDPELRWLPIIIITGFPRKSPPGILVLKKPFDPQDLLVSVARFCP